MPDTGDLLPGSLWKSMLHQLCKSQQNLVLQSKSTPCPQKQPHKAKGLQRSQFRVCCSIPVKSESWTAIWDLSRLKWPAKIICSVETAVCQTWRFGGRTDPKNVNFQPCCLFVQLLREGRLQCSSFFFPLFNEKHPAELLIDTSCISGWKDERRKKTGCNENWEGQCDGAAVCKNVAAQILTAEPFCQCFGCHPGASPIGWRSERLLRAGATTAGQECRNTDSLLCCLWFCLLDKQN